MSSNTGDPDYKNTLDALLRKYLAVWLWSITFGAVTAVTVTFGSVHVRQWGIPGILTAVLAALGSLFVVLSWYRLLQYLNDVLFPIFEGNDPRDGRLVGIKRVVVCLSWAVFFRMSIVVVEIVYGAFSY